MILLHGAPTDTPQETLLHATIEPEDRNFVGRLLIVMSKICDGGEMNASATYQLDIDPHPPRANPW